MDPRVSLRDIHGLDAPSWWPPAPGWWLILVGVLLAMAMLWWAYRAWRLRRNRWRREAVIELQNLRRGLRTMDAKQAAGELSELLRRIAMARSQRRDCAGLVGDDWLEWLHRHDPKGFEWNKRGRLLVELPYAPSAGDAHWKELRQLINAALRWVEADDISPVSYNTASDKEKRLAVEEAETAHV